MTGSNPNAFGTGLPAGGGSITGAITGRAAGLSPLFGAGTTGDTNNRVELDADGAIRFGSGSAAVDTAISRNAVGQLLISNALSTNSAVNIGGVVDISTSGAGVQVKEGANCKQGTGTLVGGTVVVSNTSVTANSRIFLTAQSVGGTAGALAVTARTAGTSFTVTSSSGTDTSTFAYEIFEPG